MFLFISSFAFALPETGISDILANVWGVFDDVLPLILLFVGVFIGFWILASMLKILLHGQSIRAYSRHWQSEDEDEDDEDDDDDYDEI